MAESALATAARPDRVHILLGVDADDPERGRYAETMPHQVILLVNETPRPVPALMDWLAKESRGDIVYSGADDLIFRTPGWDVAAERAFEAVPDRLLVAYTNDLVPGGQVKVTHFFASREWIEAVGYFMAHDFEHFGGDEWVERIAKAAGRLTWLKEVHVEHMHMKYRNPDGSPKSPRDETYLMKRRPDANGAGMSDRDKVVMQRLLPQIEAAAGRVRAAMKAAA